MKEEVKFLFSFNFILHLQSTLVPPHTCVTTLHGKNNALCYCFFLCQTCPKNPKQLCPATRKADFPINTQSKLREGRINRRVYLAWKSSGKLARSSASACCRKKKYKGAYNANQHKVTQQTFIFFFFFFFFTEDKQMYTISCA